MPTQPTNFYPVLPPPLHSLVENNQTNDTPKLDTTPEALREKLMDANKQIALGILLSIGSLALLGFAIALTVAFAMTAPFLNLAGAIILTGLVGFLLASIPVIFTCGSINMIIEGVKDRCNIRSELGRIPRAIS